MNVLEGCQWATVKAVNFAGTWRKCLCVHSVGSPLSLGLSLLLSKSATHACVAVFHKQVGGQQCSGFMCSWSLLPNSSSLFSSSPSAPWPWQVQRVGRYRQALPVLRGVRQAPAPVQKVCCDHTVCDTNFHPSLARVWACYKPLLQDLCHPIPGLSSV